MAIEPIVGGFAVSYHGSPRNTRDIDFFIRPAGENGRRVVDALKEFGFASLALTADDFSRPDQVAVRS